MYREVSEATSIKWETELRTVGRLTRPGEQVTSASLYNRFSTISNFYLHKAVPIFIPISHTIREVKVKTTKPWTDPCSWWWNIPSPLEGDVYLSEMEMLFFRNSNLKFWVTLHSHISWSLQCQINLCKCCTLDNLGFFTQTQLESAAERNIETETRKLCTSTSTSSQLRSRSDDRPLCKRGKCQAMTCQNKMLAKLANVRWTSCAC